ncbi:MAG: hypothetical protein CMC52_01795 [Flavobacteriaceae bacterium]|nr:hypothetical protein [Flavobacteriaceae bacterium]
MDFNTIFFGLLIFISLGVFFLLGPLRASAKQRNRTDRINWNKRRSPFFKYFLIAMVSILIIGFLVRLFV